ncbi:MAG: ABC transporter substrate-binding protein [Eubacteriales bacterium]|nr:ABC transporter substrate-binding protein [Eubacteriales bacterium]
MKTRRLLFISILLSFCLISSLSGCSTGKDANENTQQAARTVTDMAGRTVTLPEKIEKIANIGPVGVLNGFVQLMGEGDKICHQMPANFTKTDRWKYQPIFSPQIKDLPVLEVDKNIDLEVLHAIQPDICFTMNKETVESLKEQNIPVVFLKWTQPEDAKACIALLGEVFNKRDLAVQYNEYFDRTIAEAGEKTATLKEKKTALYGKPTDFSQPHLIAEWWLKQAGALSVTDDGRTAERLTYTTEDLLRWNPDTIFVFTQQEAKSIKETSAFQSVKAVQDDAIYVVPTVAHVWGNRTIEQPLMIFWAMHKLYPELMPKEELQTKIKDFYNTYFHYDMAPNEIDAIIGD